MRDPVVLLEGGILGSGGAVFSGEPENAGFVSKEVVLDILAVALRAGRDAVYPVVSDCADIDMLIIVS